MFDDDHHAAGPHNATYFEQAFLAQYLGYPLVEGADLAVRDGRVFLKTLGGLHPVDVILRRLNDDYCDPLELRPESLLGVPGLVQATRDGNVAIADVPSSEIPGLMARLKADPRVEAVEPMGVARILWTPNDPKYSEQWHMKRAGAESA